MRGNIIILLSIMQLSSCVSKREVTEKRDVKTLQSLTADISVNNILKEYNIVEMWQLVTKYDSAGKVTEVIETTINNTTDKEQVTDTVINVVDDNKVVDKTTITDKKKGFDYKMIAGIVILLILSIFAYIMYRRFWYI